MFEIISKKQITDNEFDITVSAPRIANHAKAGQFVVLRVGDKGERIPLTIADYDTAEDDPEKEIYLEEGYRNGLWIFCLVSAVAVAADA